MCELFGLSCNMKDRATKSLPIFQEYSKEWNANHGWGIAYYTSPNNVKRERESKQAYSSEKFSEIIQKAKSNIIISHVRLGTRGAVCEENCHPFVRNYLSRQWVFAHNGSIKNISYSSDKIEGETDSEMAFKFMLDSIIEYREKGVIRGIYPAIMHAIKKVFNSFGKEITFNFLLSDGLNLYAFHHYDGKPMYFLGRRKDYGGTVLISTRKMTGEKWRTIPKDRLLVVSGGEILILSDKYEDFS